MRGSEEFLFFLRIVRLATIGSDMTGWLSQCAAVWIRAAAIGVTRPLVGNGTPATGNRYRERTRGGYGWGV